MTKASVSTNINEMKLFFHSIENCNVLLRAQLNTLRKFDFFMSDFPFGKLGKAISLAPMNRPLFWRMSYILEF